MSLSKPRFTGQKNPAKKYISWEAKEQRFSYWDKDKEKNIPVDFESKGFVILDKDLFSISGYNKTTREFIQSNEVRGVEDKLIVKAWKDGKSTVKLEGSYKELKERIQESAIYRYTRSVYIGFQGEICHLKLVGSSFGGWREHVDKGNSDGRWITHTGVSAKTNGDVDYHEPIFKVGDKLDSNEMDDAVELDRQLQAYLEGYLSNNGQKEEEPDYENESQEVKEFDSSKWREFTYRGEKLGNYEPYQLFEAQDALERNNDCDSAEYNCVTHAIKDYQHAQKTWTSKKDKSGKLLKDYTISELQEQLKKIPGTHEVRLILHAAIEHKLAEQGPNEAPWDEENIPF